MPIVGREVQLASRPAGPITADNFAVVEVSVPDPGPDQVLVRNLYFGLNAGLLVFLDASFDLPLVLLEPGQPLSGAAIGEVVAGAGFAPGQLVQHGSGWREYAVLDSASVAPIAPDRLPSPQLHLVPGLVAYVGLEVAQLEAGQTIFVSSAAGAVGSLAGQMARLRGAGRVIGSAGSPAKVAMLTAELGFDAAFDYHDGSIVEQLRAAAPDGIDVFFDNVGGEQLEAAIEVMKPRGRVAICGWLGSRGVGPARLNSMLMINKALRLEGFNTYNHMDRAGDYQADFARWVRAGQLRVPETVIDGLDAAPQAFCDMLAGRHTGHVSVRLV